MGNKAWPASVNTKPSRWRYQAVAVAIEQPRAHRPLQCINPAGYRAVLDLQAPGGWAEPTQTRHR